MIIPPKNPPKYLHQMQVLSDIVCIIKYKTSMLIESYICHCLLGLRPLLRLIMLIGVFYFLIIISLVSDPVC